MRNRSTLPQCTLLAAFLALTISGCSVADDDPTALEPGEYILSQMHTVGQSSVSSARHFCSDLSPGRSTNNGARSDDLWTSESSDGEGLTVEIGSFDRVIVERYYDRAFIASGDVDQFLVSTANDGEYEFVYWGASECKPCPPPPYVAPPGDPLGCE